MRLRALLLTLLSNSSPFSPGLCQPYPFHLNLPQPWTTSLAHLRLCPPDPAPPPPQAPTPSVLPAALPSCSKLGSTQPPALAPRPPGGLTPWGVAPPLCPESCVETQLPHISPPTAMSSAHIHGRCRGAPCPHHLFSHLPFLLCSEPQNISSTILPSVHLSSLSFSFSLLLSPLPPSPSPHHHPPMWFQSPCPCVHPDGAPLSWS